MDAKEDCSILIGRTPVNVKLARKRKEQKSTGFTTAQNGPKSDERFQKFSGSGAKSKNHKALRGNQWNRGHFSKRKWESEKHKSWCMPAEGFKGHVATGKWSACGWAVVQMDYDEEMGPLHGMYGLLEAEFEVQRVSKRAELTAFLCLLRKVSGPIKIHVDNKGIIDGLRKGEKESIKPGARDAVLWIKNVGRIT